MAILYLIEAILLICIVIVVHEWGHFIVARAFKIPVTRFSVGFGRALLTYRSKSGTAYTLSVMPLGGFVQFAETGTGHFSSQPPWVQLLVTAAGPAINFVLTFTLMWVLSMGSVTQPIPVIGQVAPQSAAARAGIVPGHEIVGVYGHPVQTWREIFYWLFKQNPRHRELTLTTKSLPSTGKSLLSTGLSTEPRTGKSLPSIGVRGVNQSTARDQSTAHHQTHTYHLTLPSRSTSTDKGASPIAFAQLRAAGITPYQPTVPLVIRAVEPRSPALAAGLKVGDRIVAINQKPVATARELIPIVQELPGKTVTLRIQRDGRELNLPVLVGATASQATGRRLGHIGVLFQPKPYPAHLLRQQHYNVITALGRAVPAFKRLFVINALTLGRLVTGELSISHVMGPIGVAQVAYQSAVQGWVYYLGLMAFLSASIGFINLLPIPLLDGGQMVFQALHWLRGRPLSSRIQGVFFRFGVLLIFLFLLLVTFQDVARLWKAF